MKLSLKTAAIAVALFSVAWSAIGSYTVTFDRNGGNGNMSPQSIDRDTSKALAANAFSKAGYSFGGWAEVPDGPVRYTNSQSVRNLADEGGGITLYAVWNANTYYVAFNANGGVGAMPAQAFTYDATAVPLSKNKFTYKGYLFEGWSTTAKGDVVFTDEEAVSNLAASGTTTLYAVWKSNSFTVVFNANGGLGAMEEQLFTLGVAEPLAKNAFTFKGRAFIGWAQTAKGDVVFDDCETVVDLAASGTVTLYAVWGSGGCAIVFFANGGSGFMPLQVVASGTTTNLDANAFLRSGYAFAGWATTRTGGVVYKDGQKVKDLANGSNLVLYAVWAKKKYKVAFNANGGSGRMATESFTFGKAKKLSACTFRRPGYVFMGWAKSAAKARKRKVAYADGKKVKNLTTKGGTVNLHATWAKKKYKVAFNANGGSGKMAKKSFTYGKAKKLSACTFTRAGFTFAGWATSKARANKGLVSYSDRQKVKNLTPTGKAVTLYAVWK